MNSDDRTLLRKTHAGHEPSARELWRRHAGWMLAFARAVVGPRGVSPDDVVQEVFCRLLGLDRRAIREVREVRPWLAQLTRREALNQLRAARRAAHREARARLPEPPLAPLHEPRDLAAAVARLPRGQREVVHLRHIVGLSTDQTAEALGVPRGTVASRSHAAMRALRALLDPPAHSPAHALTPPPAPILGDPCHALAD